METVMDNDYFSELDNELKVYLDQEQVGRCYEAFKLAEKAHAGQMRRSGEPYITHPVAAALILAKMRLDSQTIMATLLHDVIEDTSVTKSQLAETFGSDVAELVDGVSKLTKIKFESRAEAQAENFGKMVLAMVRDIRVIIVKLADRLHNMQTLGVMPSEKRRRIAIETLEIYSPIANRLGMHKVYIGLEDLGFKALYPMRYRALEEGLKKIRGKRQEIMLKIQKDIEQASKKFQVPIISIFGRQKHLYSIYKKMRAKKASFTEIMDVFGFRVITKDADLCYRMLGALHRTYKPVPERFKDYIGIPKANGYQSLHTSLFGPSGIPIEVQIRSQDMDRVAENGIAAHWIYKSETKEVERAHIRARAWVKSLLDMRHSSSLEFIENVKIDLFPDEVYVFTPKGHIMELPRGATPVDFAYMVHSDVGNSCVAAKINRRLAPLSMTLSNGQTVEIITAPGASPNPAWLNFVVTGKARSNIRHYLKNQQLAQFVSLGKRLLISALEAMRASYEKLPNESLQALLEDLGYKTEEELFKNIGLGNQMAEVIAERLIYRKPMALDPRPAKSKKEALAIKGTEGMVVSYAECCRPIPGDSVIGLMGSGSGIKVHRENCVRIKKISNSKNSNYIYLRWDDSIDGEFWVEVTVEVANRRGVLAILASAIAEAGANIGNIKVDPKDGRYSDVHFLIAVSNRVHLARVMRKIKQHRVVNRLYRNQEGNI
jgi:guanosine-3',5'-bis(diphosphate) 3'-pyrophosphohydrolase